MEVNRLDAEPLVVDANRGNKLLAVAVSLLIAAPPTEANAVPLYPSNSAVVVLNRNMPETGEPGR